MPDGGSLLSSLNLLEIKGDMSIIGPIRYRLKVASGLNAAQLSGWPCIEESEHVFQCRSAWTA